MKLLRKNAELGGADCTARYFEMVNLISPPSAPEGERQLINRSWRPVPLKFFKGGQRKKGSARPDQYRH